MKLALKLGYAGVAAAIGLLLALVPEVGATAEKRAGGMSNKRLIEQGRQLFMNETFDGNGRTCATCHPPANNFTIDPEFIASLPDDDPLFVAEFNPALGCAGEPAPNA
jgi:cytochrome c peroxidase